MHEKPPTLNGHLPTGEKAKARDILAAIRTLKTVEREQRPPTDDEMQALRRFGGFGAVALSIFPDPVTGRFKDGWQEIGEELKSLLSPEEYDSAKRTTFSQFFTSPVVMGAMHDALERLGVSSDALILEPGAGSGNFLSHGKPTQRFIGVELDGISGRIARALHPKADIRIENFRDSKLPPLDAVIGNVPFANIHLDFHGQKLSLHDFCIAKSVEALKPGGVLAVVTSHFTLDKQNAAVREQLGSQADFLGAIRLPNDAFKREGTAVTTDILFLRKRAPGQAPKHADPEWLETSEIGIQGADLPVNRYFLNHHEMVLGDWSREHLLHGAVGFSVKSNGDLASQLKEAVGRITGAVQTVSERPNPPPASEPDEVFAKSPITPITPNFQPPPPLRHITEGSLFVGDDKIIRQVENGSAEPVTYCGTLLKANGTPQGRKIGSLIELRDLARRVLQSQNEGWPEQNRSDARRTLNAAYDRFVAQHGPINKTTFTETKTGTIRRMPNLVKFREDPDAMLVMSLEEYDEGTGKAEKSAIMKKDVVGPKPPVTHVTSAEEGLLVSLNDRGAIELPYMAKLYGKPEQDIVAELGDLIYRDPHTREWQTADAYLSGNVREKLKVAEKAGPEYVRNAVALRSVQPEDVLPGDIDANLGAPWIPASDIKAFAESLFGGSFTVGHLKKDAVWSLEPDYRAIQSVAATADYGTSRINGTELLAQALNLKSVAIYDVVRGANGDERILNPTETAAAKEKQKLIKEKFKSWIFSDPDRTERLVRDYNDTYNNLRPRLFDGSHLDFPGMSQTITLKPHQVDAVWRCMTAGNTLLAHAVGAGKAQPLDAKVLTPTGWARMGNLKPGDAVIAGDGTPTVVTGVYPQGERPVYRLTFSDGATTRACGEHLWLTQTSKERQTWREANINGHMTVKGQPKIRTTEEITKTIGQRHYVPVVGEIDFQKQELPLDPYTLGVLIGNASFRQFSVQLALPEAIQLDFLRLPAGITAKTWSKPPKCPVAWLVGGGVRPNPLNQILRDLGLWGHKSPEKFIPPVYLWADAKSRFALVQGLMDSDGGMCGRTARFTSYSAQLAADMVTLVRSLGGVAHKHVGEGATPGSVKYRMDIKLPGKAPPFKLPRKVKAWEESVVNRRSLKKCFVSIEPDGIEECQCIAVAHPSRLYVTDDFVVTHNTYEMCVAGMKMKQAGIIKKPLYCLPNHMLEQFSREFMQLYPNAKLLVASKEDFTKERRKMMTAKIATGDWDAIIVTHSSFERIGMSRDYQEKFLREQIKEYESLLVDKSSSGRNIIKTLEKQKANREERLKSLLAEDKKDDGLVFDELGVDQIFYDESQAGKNLETATKMDRVAGIQTGGSERAFDLYMKARYLSEKNTGHGVVFASGTPISNSMVEMYTQCRYLDPEGLRSRGIEHFDGWAATFGEVVEAMEISPDGASLRPRSRFAKFVNLPELVQMFRAFADVQTAEMLDLPRPKLEGGKPITIACPMSEEQAELQTALVKRYERLRNEKVDPREDNALAITTDGRKLAMDGRMLQPGQDFADSKINALVRNVARIWERTADTRGTQMIFSDMGVNPTPWGFSAYDETVEKLVDHGIPRSQIAVMGDADTDAKKQALFEKVRQGTVRVLIGSTSKMGTGTNVQKRLVALHHLDAPWKPAEVEQRDGRILRQGNMNPEVAIYRYVTTGSFDSYMWQALETKARFISQVMSGDCAVRKAEDIGSQELSYAEVKAIASGNPAVLTLAETDAELQRLAILDKNHRDEQYLARRNLRDLPDDIKRLEKRLAGLEADKATMAANDVIPSQEAVGNRMSRMPEKVSETYRTPLGKYRGLEAILIQHPLGGTEVVLDGAVRCRESLRENAGPRAVLNALERLANGYDYDCRHLRSEIGIKQGQLKDFEARLGRPFDHGAYKGELEGLRDQLRAGLSEHPPEGLPPAAEVAAKIKALREANTVEAVPERTVRKAARAERPVTARIRERMADEAVGKVEAPAEVKPEAVQKPDEPPAAPPAAVIAMPQALKPVNGHAKAVVNRRQGSGEQLRLF